MNKETDREIIINMWHMQDKDSFIYKLFLKPYVFAGTDDEKLVFLRQQAKTDYLVASMYDVPEKYLINENGQQFNFTHQNLVMELGGLIGLYEDAFVAIQSNLPPTTKLKIPDNPLTCMTPLLPDENGELYPHFDSNQKW